MLTYTKPRVLHRTAILELRKPNPPQKTRATHVLGRGWLSDRRWLLRVLHHGYCYGVWANISSNKFLGWKVFIIELTDSRKPFCSTTPLVLHNGTAVVAIFGGLCISPIVNGSWNSNSFFLSWKVTRQWTRSKVHWNLWEMFHWMRFYMPD